MPVTQYIGARYMPIFADPPEHSSAKTYEPLTIVLHEGNSYTSKQFVPKGIQITNETYWAETGNYNAQVEAYRREALAAKATADEAQANATAAQNDIDNLLPKSYFSSSDTVKKYIDNNEYKIWLESQPAMRPKARFVTAPSDSATYEPPFYGGHVAQASCIATIAGNDYWVCATGPDNENHIVVVDINTNTVITTIDNLPLGHANCLSYNGSDTIVCANSINRTIVFIDVSNINDIHIANAVPTPNNESIVDACFVDNTKVALIHGQLSGFNFNVTGATVYADSTLTTVSENITFNYNSNIYGGWQSVTSDGSYWYITHSKPECVEVLNYDGSYFTRFTPESVYGRIRITELESCFIHKNYLYLAQWSPKTSTKYHDTDNIICTSELLRVPIMGASIISCNREYRLPNIEMAFTNFAWWDIEGLYNADSRRFNTALVGDNLNSSVEIMFIEDAYAELEYLGLNDTQFGLSLYSDINNRIDFIYRSNFTVRNLLSTAFHFNQRVRISYCNNCRLGVGGSLNNLGFSELSLNFSQPVTIQSNCIIGPLAVSGSVNVILFAGDPIGHISFSDQYNIKNR